MLFLDSSSAVVLHASGIWLAVREIGCKKPQTAEKMHDHDAPLLTAFTGLKLSHRISTDCLENCGPQIIQLSTIGTSSYA